MSALHVTDDITVASGIDPQSVVEAISEPGALGLLAVGALGILGRRRRAPRRPVE